MEIFLWLIVIFGYLLSIYLIYKVFVFSFSLFNEVPFVASDKKIALEALKYLEIKEEDRFVDIGSGDGSVVFLAHKKYPKAKSYDGYELSKALTLQSNIRKFLINNSKNIHFHNGDAKEYNYARYTKVFLYMTTQVTSELMFKLEKELKKNSVVVSAVFSMGDFAKSHKVNTEKVKIKNKEINIYIWKK